MATFTPITITSENISWALNENVRMLFEVLGTKLPIAQASSLLGSLNAGGQRVSEVAYPVTRRSAATKLALEVVATEAGL